MIRAVALSGEDWFYRKCWRLASCHKAARWARYIRESSSPASAQAALMTIWLIEMSARPAVARAAEWAASWLLRPIPAAVRRRSQTITLGPLQMRGARWSPRAAVELAINRLLHSSVDWADAESLADYWHGPASHLYTSTLSYRRAIDIARPFAGNILAGDRR